MIHNYTQQKMNDATIRERRGSDDHPVPNHATSRPSVSRIAEIDGIRGWAALAVVIFHALPETFWKIHPEFVRPIYWFFIDGSLAVCIFFILSGDALSTPFLSNGNSQTLDKMVIKRYLRLSVPIFLLTAISMGAMACGWVASPQAAQIVNRSEWLGTFLNFRPALKDLFFYPFFHVFGGGFGPVRVYSQFLWTMPVELPGSILVFLYLYIHQRLVRPLVVVFCIFMFMLVYQPWYSLFFFGVMLSHLRANGSLDRLRKKTTVRITGFALAAGAYTLEYYLHSTPPNAMPVGAVQLVISFLRDNEKIINAILFVTGVYLSKDLCRIFRSRISNFLGTISFPIYLVQLVVLCTVSSNLIVRFEHELLNRWVCLAIAATSVCSTLVIGYAFSFAERHSMKLVDRAVNTITKNLGRRTTPNHLG